MFLFECLLSPLIYSQSFGNSITISETADVISSIGTIERRHQLDGWPILNLTRKAWVPHLFAFFAKGWDTSNSMARKRRLAAPQVLADHFQHPATLKLDRPSGPVRFG